MVSSTVITLLSLSKPTSPPWGLIQASSRQDGLAKSDMSTRQRFGESFAAPSNLMLGKTAASTIQPPVVSWPSRGSMQVFPSVGES
jgi:hypothetical protein